jgi:hypothetical protein
MTSRVRLTKNRPALTANTSSAERLLPFGPPPLIYGENAAAYDELLANGSTALRPTDLIEDIWVREFVDLTWEAFRWNRLKASLMSYKARVSLSKTLNSLLEEGADELALKWAQQKAEAVTQVNRILASAGTTIDMVIATALPECIHQIIRIDNMLATIQSRRNAVLREIDRHRAMLGQGLRKAAQQIEEAEYQVLEEQPVDGTKAA